MTLKDVYGYPLLGRIFLMSFSRQNHLSSYQEWSLVQGARGDFKLGDAGAVAVSYSMLYFYPQQLLVATVYTFVYPQVFVSS